MPGAVHPFLFATSFFTFSRVMLNSLTWLTFSFSCLFISSIHGIYGFLSSLSLSLSLRYLFQRSKESLLVPLEHDIILLPSPFFLTFCHFYIFVRQLVQPLLSGISQIVISCTFIDQDSQFLDNLLFFLVTFLCGLLLYSSLLVSATIWRNSLISFFNFRSCLFPPFNCLNNQLL